MQSPPFRFLIALFLFVGLLIFACQSGSKSETAQETSSETINEGERIIDKTAFAEGIKKRGTVLIDVRQPQEFEQGHIEGATNINFFDPEFKYKLLELDRDKTYYLYCKNETRSYRSMKFMEDNDFRNVYMLKGGYEAWLQSDETSDTPQ
jgi:rhodanese-related sulfurtransferase